MQSPKDILKQYWNYNSFRPLQEEIIDAVLQGKDTLAILPTGGGKSICYQIPGIAMEGMCLVISPLIALMQDQLEGLQKRDIPAAVINSSLSFRETELILDNCYYGAYKFLFIAPERLHSESFIQRIKGLKLSFVAVDEAHCISEWGYDFRPSYLTIPMLKEYFPDIHFLALTASATENARADIQRKLQFPKEHLIQGSFKRTNIGYIVRETENKKQKLLEILEKVQGSTIIYAATRNACDSISLWLTQQGIGAMPYHAGLNATQRSTIQNKWLQDKFRVIVATNAFGMGIDKPSVRLVLHLDMPTSLEAYYQEAGRAGRDGINSYAIVLYEKRDALRLQERMANLPTLSFITEVYKSLCNTLQIAQGDGSLVNYPIDLGAFCQQRNYKIHKVLEAIKVLEYEGHFKLNITGNYGSTLQILLQPTALNQFLSHKPHFEKVIQTLLRSYSGLFERPMLINENIVAKRCNLSIEELNKQLLALKQEHIINYQKESSTNSIDWIVPRQAFKHFGISKESIDRIEQINKKQIKASIDYLINTECRSKQLLQYFGELVSENCGVCDICRADKATSLETKEIALQNALLSFLRKGKQTMPDICTQFKAYSTERLIATIRVLTDNGSIEQINDLEYQIKAS